MDVESYNANCQGPQGMYRYTPSLIYIKRVLDKQYNACTESNDYHFYIYTRFSDDIQLHLRSGRVVTKEFVDSTRYTSLKGAKYARNS